MFKEFEGGGEKFGVSIGQERIATIWGTRGRDRKVCIRIVAPHFARFCIPIVAVIALLDDAQRVDPQVRDVKHAGECDGILVHLGQLVPVDA